MDSSQLIVLVQEYEELYNLRHPQYSNQQRRDTIWEKIGMRMNQPTAACKSRWTRIRDNHRKALNLRKTKSGQGALKMKPPKFHKELQFLTPYITDEEEIICETNLPNSHPDESTDLEDEENGSESQNAATTNTFQTLFTDNSPTQSHSKYLSSSTRNRGKIITGNSTPQPSAATVLENYLKCNAMQIDSSNQLADPFIEFFINMARTVKNFPLQDQIKIKGQLFQIVHGVEMRLAEEALLSNQATQQAAEQEPQEMKFSQSPNFLQLPTTSRTATNLESRQSFDHFINFNP